MRLFALVLLVAAWLAAPPSASADYGVLRQFGSPGSGPGQFNNPLGISVGPDGHAFVADGLNDRVQEFLPDGTYVRSFGKSGTQRGDLWLPEDVLSDGTSLFVTDCYNGRVTQFALASGGLVNAWGRGEHVGDPSFNCPEAMAMSANGVLYVADTFNQRVVSFDPHIGAASFQSFGQAGTGPGQFTQVHGIEFDQDGNLLVGDDEPHTCTYARIMRFSPAGAYLGQFGTFTAGTAAGQLFCVQDIERDAAGNVFVSDAGERVFAFAPNGTLVRQISAPGQLGFVIGLDSNSSCELYGVDRNNARVEVLGWRDSPKCRPVTPLASSLGSLPPDKTSPTLVASVAATVKLGKPLKVAITCPFEDCTVRVTANATLRRGNVSVLASARTRLSAGRRATMRLRLGSSTIARVRRYLRTHRRLHVTVVVFATDAAGNFKKKTLHVALQ